MIGSLPGASRGGNLSPLVARDHTSSSRVVEYIYRRDDRPRLLSVYTHTPTLRCSRDVSSFHPQQQRSSEKHPVHFPRPRLPPRSSVTRIHIVILVVQCPSPYPSPCLTDRPSRCLPGCSCESPPIRVFLLQTFEYAGRELKTGIFVFIAYSTHPQSQTPNK